MNVERKMSAQQSLSHHLSDYLVLIDKLLSSLLTFQNDTSGQVGKDVVDKILRKDNLIQEAVTNLVEHQQFQQKIIDVQKEIGELDSCIVSFTKNLGDLEQKIHDAVTDEKTLKNIDGIITKQSFSVHDVTVFAEKLAKMSFAPADYIEKKGMSAAHEPPRPVEKDMCISMLHCSLEDLLRIKSQNEDIEMWLKQREEAEFDSDKPDELTSTGVPPSFDAMNDDAADDSNAWKPSFEASVAGASLRKGETLLSLELDDSDDDDDDDDDDDGMDGGEDNNFSGDDFG